MTIDPSQVKLPKDDLGMVKPVPFDSFAARLPISVSISHAESKMGILKNYTAYCVKVNDFGRNVEVFHRYDDFAKLHESLQSISGVSLPALPGKQFFGGNDPRVIEERRPVLEQLLQACVSNENILANDAIYKFLNISPVGSIVAKFLLPSTRLEFLPKLVALLKPEVLEVDRYRLFSESVIKTLLHLLKSPNQEISHEIVILDVLQYILLNSFEGQNLFADLLGIPIVWSLLCARSDLRESCRKVLSALITSNLGNMEKFERNIFKFLNDQDGFSLLLKDLNADDLICEIAAKLVWFGLSPEVQRILAKKGLPLLGALFGCPNANAQCLAGLTLCVLLCFDHSALDAASREKSLQGVSHIMAKFGASSTDRPTRQFLSTICKTGMDRILHCIEVNSDLELPAWVVAHAELPLEFIQEWPELVPLFESKILASPEAQSCAIFLFRLYSEFSLLPVPRKDPREVVALLHRVGTNMATHTEESRKVVRNELAQFKQFGTNLIANQFGPIKQKMNSVDEFGKVNFADFQLAVNAYLDLGMSLETNVESNSALVEQLATQIASTNSSAWSEPSAEILKEWNLSAFGMKTVSDRIALLEQNLGECEAKSKSAASDAANLQSVISKMREEIVQTDQKAENLRAEATRFSAAASGAVDSELMMQRASDAEEKAIEQIAVREALRQSQDSLETQLAEVRAELVRQDISANSFRKALTETRGSFDSANRQHEEIEIHVKKEMEKTLANWNSKLSRKKNSLMIVNEIFSNYNAISKLIENENEQKDVLSGIVVDLILKLQRLQGSL